MKVNRTIRYVGIIFGLLFLSSDIHAQSNWKIAEDSTQFNLNDTAKIWRSGALSISQQHSSPLRNMVLISTKYDSLLSRGMYVGVNEPRYDLETPDSTTVGMVIRPQDSAQGLIVNNYANFKSGVSFTDVHTSAGEFNMFRGLTDSLGYRDGGNIAKLAAVKVSSSFGNNARPYRTQDFDFINLRLFTSNDAGNAAEIENFYGLRLEDFRGVNANIIKNGWGIYIAPSQLKNYFSGQVGIGTTVIAHALTVSSPADPIQVSGLQYSSEDSDVLTVDQKGVVHKKSLPSARQNFVTTLSHTTLSEEVSMYIHKGGDATFTLPPAGQRKGQSWQIVNMGSGIITLSEPFCVGNESHRYILNTADHYSYELFSDGEAYISIR